MPSIANKYLVGRTRGGAASRRAEASVDWLSMFEELEEEIVKHASLEVVQRDEQLRMTPADLGDMTLYPFLFIMAQEYVFSRAREKILQLGKLLTITFSDSVERTRLQYATDVDRLCARMDYKQTWSGISKIRLRHRPTPENIELQFYVFEFVRRGHDGEDEVVEAPPERFMIRNCFQKRVFAFRLVEELQLRHAVVDGVDEFSC